MATDIVLDFYESINFELIDIDGYDTLALMQLCPMMTAIC